MCPYVLGLILILYFFKSKVHAVVGVLNIGAPTFCCMSPSQPFNERDIYYISPDLWSFLFWGDIWAFRNPELPAKKKKSLMGRQGLTEHVCVLHFRIYLKNGVKIWAFFGFCAENMFICWFKHKTLNSFRVQCPRRFLEIDPEFLHVLEVPLPSLLARLGIVIAWF